MPSSCSGWCGADSPDGFEKCAGCQSLEEPFFGLHHSQRPDSRERESVNSFIEPARGLSDQQKMLSLAGATEEYCLPPGFRSSRGPNRKISKSLSSEWENLANFIKINGYVPRGQYSLPDCTLEVDPDSRISIDGIMIEGPLPMLDISEWLSSPHRVTAIRSWKNFLIALSCCCRDFSNLPDRAWPSWLSRNAWHGIDVPEPSMDIEFRGVIPPPFISLIALLSGRKATSEKSLGSIARGSISLISEFGGLAAEAWSEIIRKSDSKDFSRLFSLRIHPRLVVERGRLQLIVLRSGKPTTIPVVVDVKVWRVLVNSILYPSGHEGSNLSNSIYWVWDSRDSEWRPTVQQERSARFLRGTIDSLGIYSTNLPVKHLNDENTGIMVLGESGIVYVINASEHSGKFSVFALPSSIHIGDTHAHIPLCIDPNQISASKNLCAGDICASYVLALRNDITSRNQIFTLNVLLSSCEHVNENYEVGDLDEWWAMVEGHYEMWEDMEDHDPEYDPEYEPEPEPEPEPDMFADIDPEMPTEDMIRWHAESIEELFENITRNSMGDGEIG